MNGAAWTEVLAAIALAFASPAAAQAAKALSPAEKLASALMESRRCEVVPESGYTECNYEVPGLRFTRGKLPGVYQPSVEILSASPPMRVAFTPGFPCITIWNADDLNSEIESGAAGAARIVVQFNARDGKFYVGGNHRECGYRGPKGGKS